MNETKLLAAFFKKIKTLKQKAVASLLKYKNDCYGWKNKTLHRTFVH